MRITRLFSIPGNGARLSTLIFPVIFALIGGLLLCGPQRPGSSQAQSGSPARFAIRGDSTWHLPEPGKITRMELYVEMTNLGKDTIRFALMDPWSISLRDPSGRRLSMDGGRDGLIDKEPYSEPVEQGGSYLYRLNCRLAYGLDGKPGLIIRDGYGGIWQIAPLAAGRYQLIMRYNSVLKKKNQPQDVWRGSAKIKAFPVHIVRDSNLMKR